MTKVAIAEDVFWVGVVDWNIRDFHGYTTSRGSSLAIIKFSKWDS